MNAISNATRALIALRREREHHAARVKDLDQIIAQLEIQPVSVSRPIKALPLLTGKVKRRFHGTPELNPEQVTGLAESHPAVVEGRTLFPTTVMKPEQSPRLLVSGEHNRKLGDRILKGPWAGFAVYHLTLEERATCPRTCFNWLTCYGNGMPQARRHSTKGLEPRLLGELIELGQRHPKGYAVRLHTLGDFHSVEYVQFWKSALLRVPALHVFGYTAWGRDTPIGQAVSDLTHLDWNRFAIRFSAKEMAPQGATTIFTKPESPRIGNGIVCPAELGKTEACGSCGLCWHPAARDKTIVFVAHGPAFKRDEAPDAPVPGRNTGNREQRTAAERVLILKAIAELQTVRMQATAQRISARTNIPYARCIALLDELKAEGKACRTGNRSSTNWFVGATPPRVDEDDADEDRRDHLPQRSGPAKPKWMCATARCFDMAQPGKSTCVKCTNARLSRAPEYLRAR